MPPPNTTVPTPFAHETLTVADSAAGLTAATYLEASRAEMEYQEGKRITRKYKWQQQHHHTAQQT